MHQQERKEAREGYPSRTSKVADTPPDLEEAIIEPNPTVGEADSSPQRVTIFSDCPLSRGSVTIFECNQEVLWTEWGPLDAA